jgi:hypothetical protein
MMQAATQIRKWWEGAKPVVAWMKGHATAAMAVTLLLVAAVGLMEHDARLQREAELGVTRRVVATEVSALRQRAQAAIEQSRTHERAIRDLEARRTALEREASSLRARLNSLREEDRLRARPAITPGHNDAAGSATSRPGPAGFADRDWGRGVRDSGRDEESEPGQDLNPRSASLQPHGGDLPASSFRFPTSDIEGPNPESRIPDPALDACREQIEVQGQLISNCEKRVELNRVALDTAKESALELGEALRAKDAMAARLEEQHRAELKAARGSRLRRFGRALQYVGVGVVMGMAVAL